MRTHGSPAELEARRLTAGELLPGGKGVTQVAGLLGLSTSAVSRWEQTVDQQGLEGLKATRHPGKRPRLSKRRKQRLVKILDRGPRKAGYGSDLWTCGRVAKVIERTFGVHYHPDHVWRILTSLGFSCQKPERRASERDDEAIRRWRKQDWPRINKGAPTES